MCHTRSLFHPSSFRLHPSLPGATPLLHIATPMLQNATLLLHNATLCYTPATPNSHPISAVTTAKESTSNLPPYLTMLHSCYTPATPVPASLLRHTHYGIRPQARNIDATKCNINATQCNIDATKCNTLQHRCNILKRCQNRRNHRSHHHFRIFAIP